VLPGLEVTVPPGWTTNEVTPGEVNLVPPTPQNVELDFWLDLVAVKSSGAGHGTTILKNVAGTPDALTRWLTRNPDFLIVSKPRSVVIGHGIAMTSLTIGISRSVNYGDPRCPDNPRCADLFTNSYWAADQGFYGIGGDDEIRLYLGTIHISGKHHTFLIALHADNHFDLLSLDKVAATILSSVRLPAGTTSS